MGLHGLLQGQLYLYLSYTVGRTPWTGDHPVAMSLPTHRTTHTQNTSKHTDIYASSGIRTHDPTVQAEEDGSCLSAVTVISNVLSIRR
jgi:hypothetical protein